MALALLWGQAETIPASSLQGVRTLMASARDPLTSSTSSSAAADLQRRPGLIPPAAAAAAPAAAARLGWEGRAAGAADLKEHLPLALVPGMVARSATAAAAAATSEPARPCIAALAAAVVAREPLAAAALALVCRLPMASLLLLKLALEEFRL